MQATPEQLPEDHDHSSNLEHSVRLREDLGTQETNSEFQESYDDAPQTLEHAVRSKEDLGTHETNSEDQSFHDAEEEEEFSFTFDGAITSPIAAEDAFLNGQIRPMFPLFNQDLLLQERYFDENLIANPNVKKVLVEMNERSLGKDQILGPYCEWEPERERCKKSSSTGFSKLWRLKDLVVRSNSDGRDTFVFLNKSSSSYQNASYYTRKDNQNTSSFRKKEEKKGASYTRKEDQNSSSFRRKEDKKATTSGGGGEEEGKKGGKKKTASLSSHEVYLKNKAKENDGRKKSYMPYKPEVVGFFTNANGGGISKNVHPY